MDTFFFWISTGLIGNDAHGSNHGGPKNGVVDGFDFECGCIFSDGGSGSSADSAGKARWGEEVEESRIYADPYRHTNCRQSCVRAS